MKPLRVLWHLVKADFLSRTRRPGFLLTLGFTVFVGYQTFAGGIVIDLGPYRGIYNSAWVGALMGAVTSVFLSLVGFYIVKGAVQRDVETRVGQVLAATPMTKSFYTLAKALGNFAVLGSMAAVMAAAALVMQLARGEDRAFHAWALWGPMVLLALPAMAVVAAMAVLFETLPVLRGGVGNVAWFFLWTGLLVAGVRDVHGPNPAATTGGAMRDFSGLGTIFVSTRAALLQVNPAAPESFAFNIGGEKPAQRFVWDGIHWSAGQVAARLGWVALALVLALVAAVFFHRFDPAREWFAKRGLKSRAPVAEASEAGNVVSIHAANGAAWHGVLTPVARVAGRANFAQLVAAELRLMLKGQKWWWYAGAVGLFVACLASPLDAGRGGVIAAAWIWPLLVWSQMGSREARWQTGALLYCAPHTLGRQLPAAWVAGVLAAAAIGGGLAIRLALAGDWHALCGWAAGAMFIPSLALALGLWTGTSKWFEAVYTVLWWYVGALHHVRGLDYSGVVAASSTPGLFALASAVLLASCWLRRRTQLGYA
jgi:hypothetical protein